MKLRRTAMRAAPKSPRWTQRVRDTSNAPRASFLVLSLMLSSIRTVRLPIEGTARGLRIPSSDLGKLMDLVCTAAVQVAIRPISTATRYLYCVVSRLGLSDPTRKHGFSRLTLQMNILTYMPPLGEQLRPLYAATSNESSSFCL